MKTLEFFEYVATHNCDQSTTDSLLSTQPIAIKHAFLKNDSLEVRSLISKEIYYEDKTTVTYT